MESLRDFFRPEFLNRLDEIVIFDTLSKDVIKEIVEAQLALVTERLAKKSLTVSYTNDLIDHLAEKGFDPQYGARPLKRLIQNEILNDVALKMVKRTLVEGDKVVVDFKDGAVVVSKKTRPAKKSTKMKKKVAV